MISFRTLLPLAAAAAGLAIVGLSFSGCVSADNPAPPAPTNKVCAASIKDLAGVLWSEWGEIPETVGMSDKDLMVVTFVGPGGHWDRVNVRQSGIACIVEMGNTWRILPRREPRTGDWS